MNILSLKTKFAVKIKDLFLQITILQHVVKSTGLGLRSTELYEFTNFFHLPHKEKQVYLKWAKYIKFKI